MNNKLRLAVLIPCFNEEVAIGTVVRDFQRVLPQATIYVFDNNSRDNTVAIARSLGAVVRHVPLQGKGNVMRRMFADVEAATSTSWSMAMPRTTPKAARK